METEALIPVVVFAAVYVAISFEWLHKATAAVLGVMTLLILGVIDEHAAASHIDFETIMLLIGMMGIVAVGFATHLSKEGFGAKGVSFSTTSVVVLRDDFDGGLLLILIPDLDP